MAAYLLCTHRQFGMIDVAERRPQRQSKRWRAMRPQAQGDTGLVRLVEKPVGFG